MKIYQMLPVLAYGDAIGNDAIALHHIMKEAGYTTRIYAEVVDQRFPAELCGEINTLPLPEPEDVILYHLSTGSELNYKVLTYNCHIAIIYHNITPPQFFNGYDIDAFRNSRRGLAAARFMAGKVEYALADSDYNKKELMKLGYQCKIDVLPILIPFTDYDQEPSQEVLEQMRDGRTNIIFTGRVVPNKKQEDIIAAFAAYKKYYDSEARLILVGSCGAIPGYYVQLKRYVEQLGVKDVVFTDHISFDKILAYYHTADVFLCMSEHEGFCVPLVEAMYFKVPIVAYDSTAIAGTLGDSGVLLSDKDPLVTAGVIHRVMTDTAWRSSLIEREQERLKAFRHSAIKRQFYQYLKEFLDSRKE